MLTIMVSQLQINVAIFSTRLSQDCSVYECVFAKAHTCVGVFVCVTGWSFTVVEPPNPGLSMSSSTQK